MPRLTLIAAIDRNYAIGYKNRLLYKLPNDMKRFKEITTGHTVLMGRKTFESLPKGALPNRRNIVLSTSLKKAYPDTEIYSSVAEALSHCDIEEEVYVMGGEMVYKECISLADTLQLTEIESEVKQADAFFPEFNKAEWDIIDKLTHPLDEKHKIEFSYITYKRIK